MRLRVLVFSIIERQLSGLHFTDEAFTYPLLPLLTKVVICAWQ